MLLELQNVIIIELQVGIFWQTSLLSHCHSPLATTSLLPASLRSGFSYYICKWDHTAFVFLCLTYFTYKRPSSFIHVLPIAGFSSFYGWIIFFCARMCVSHFFIHSFVWEHLCFHGLAILSNAVMNMKVQVSVSEISLK